MQFSFKHSDGCSMVQPILGHFRANGTGTDNHNLGILWEVCDFMTKGDESGIELVYANHGYSNSIANFKNRIVVGNETSDAITLDSDYVWQPMNEIIYRLL
jgi:hypothetical protein